MGLSVGLVGLGQFGSGFVSLFQKHPLVDRLVLCDVQRERVAQALTSHGLSDGCSSLDELLQTDVQAVALFTQPWLHAQQALAALRAGKHVYSAVPPAYVADGDGQRALALCDQLVRAVEQTGLIYMLGETSFYRAETVYCRQQAAGGAFGGFVYGECEYWHDIDSPNCSLREVAHKRWGDQWHEGRRGSVPMHYPTHSLGSMVAIMDAHVTSVSARGYRHPGEDWFLEQTATGNVLSNEIALYGMSNGASVRHTEFRRIGHPGREGMRLFGTAGCFLDDLGGPKWCTVDGWERIDLGKVRPLLPEPLMADLGGHGGSHAYLVDEFVNACHEDRTPAISVWDAVRYLAPGIMAHESALRDGELLDVPDWGDPPR